MFPAVAAARYNFAMMPLDPPPTTVMPPNGHPAARAALCAAIADAGGAITFARFMEIALYHPEGGYYRAVQARPGRAGDFLTAPEAHPFFGRALARQVAECWERLDRPDPLIVREYGAGTGALAYDILTGLAEDAPQAFAATRYRLIETNPHRGPEALTALAEVGFGDRVALETPAAAAEPTVGVALANEVADALPVHRLIWREGEPRERWVALESDHFVEREGPLSPEMTAFDPAAYLARHGVLPDEGAAIDISPAAAAWFGGVVRGLARGYAIIIDYGYEAAELYRGHRLAGTVRAYRNHTVTDDPFAAPGQEDLTAHVDFTLLREAAAAAGGRVAGFTTQGALLAGLGLGDLLVRLGQDPQASPADYYAAQAAILRLVDPGGMGRFGALIVARGAPVAPPLRAFSVRL
ncbi:MAG: SAM-dependent methyltransferase [Thermomicrobiales bacterium]|nr:SAM-dependent methyltransferase [Thermomicrobiales bacterium]